MNKHRREESEMKHHAKHREKKEHHKKHMSHGGSAAHGDVGFNGERTRDTDSYAGSFSAVDKMLKGEHPTTHLGTIQCAKGGEMGSHHERKHMAAGGVGKVRKGEY